MSEPRHNRSYIFLLAVCGFVALWWASLQGISSHETSWNYIFNLVYGIPYLLGGIVLAVKIRKWFRRESAGDGRSLSLIGGSMIAYGAGQFAWTYYNIVAQVEAPIGSVADIFYIWSRLLLLLGFSLLLSHKEIKVFNPKRHIAISYFLLLMPLILAIFSIKFSLGAFPEEIVGSIINFFYTFTSIILVFLLFLNIYRDVHQTFRTFFVISFCATIISGLGDAMYAFRTFENSYWNGDISDGLFALGGCLFLTSVFFLPSITKQLQKGEKDIERFSVRRFHIFFPLVTILFSFFISVQISQFVFTSQQEELLLQIAQYRSARERAWRSTIEDHLARLKSLQASYNGNFSFHQYFSVLEKVKQFDAFYHITADGKIEIGSDTFPVISQISLPKERENLDVIGPVNLSNQETPVFLFTANIPDKSIFVAVVTVEHFIEKTERYYPKSENFLEVIQTKTHDIIELNGKVDIIDKDADISLYSDEWIHRSEGSFVVSGDKWNSIIIPTGKLFQALYQANLRIFFLAFGVGISFALFLYFILTQHMRLKHLLYLQTKDLEDRMNQLEQQGFYLNAIHDLVFVAGVDERIIYTNKAVTSQLGFDEGVLKGSPLLSTIFGRDVAVDALRSEIAKNEVFQKEVVFNEKQTKPLYYRMAFQRLTDNNQATKAIVAVGHDMTAEREALNMKNQFVSLVSHQLRAPMAQLRWLTEAMLDTPRIPKATKETLTQINQIVIQENKLVSDLLNVSRIERGVLTIQHEEGSVKSIIEEIIEPLKPLAKERHIKVAIEKIPDITFTTDRQKLIEALRNIVDNALKYCPEKSVVEIVTQVKKQSLVIHVRDHGAGIPEELWGTLFDVKTTATNSQSTGLGLFLSKKFIEALNGSITFTSSSAGTRFVVTLPLLHSPTV